MRLWDRPWLRFTIFLASHRDPGGEPEPAPLNLRGLIAVLALLAFLVVFSLHIIDVLRRTDRVQDCVMQGRTNCAPGMFTRHH